MKRDRTLRPAAEALVIAATFTGCFLGAGYVSGQEIYQFFGAFGAEGVVGLILAISVIFAAGCLLLRLTMLTRDGAIDRTVVGADRPVLLFLVGAAEIAMMFGTYFVMIAGAGALFEQITGLDGTHYASAFVFTVLVSLLALLGLKGLMRLFTAAVPLLVAFTVFIAAASLVKNGGLPVFAEVEHTNPLLPNWAIASVSFASYNYFCCVGVMCPVGAQLQRSRIIAPAILTGSCFLFLVAFGVIITVNACPEAAEASLPMLAAAEWVWSPLRYAFAGLLFLAITGAALSVLIPTATYFEEKISFCSRHKIVTVCAVSLPAFLLSCFGFTELVGTVFSTIGYLSLVILFGIIRHYIVVKKRTKCEDDTHGTI